MKKDIEKLQTKMKLVVEEHARKQVHIDVSYMKIFYTNKSCLCDLQPLTALFVKVQENISNICGNPLLLCFGCRGKGID